MKDIRVLFLIFVCLGAGSALAQLTANQQQYLVGQVNTVSSVFSTTPCDPSNLKKMWSTDMVNAYNTKKASGTMLDETKLNLGLTLQESIKAVQKHNEFRNLTAAGNRLGNGSQPLEAAKDLGLLRREPQLECGALSWLLYYVLVKPSTGSHSITPTMRNNAGENAAAYWTSTTGGSLNYDYVKSWFSEEASMTNDLIHSFSSPTGVTIGHYTEVVWDRVTRIGCSRVIIPKTASGSTMEETRFLCQYAGEPGSESSSWPNMISNSVFQGESGVISRTSASSSDTCANSNLPTFTKRGYDSRYPMLCGNPNYAIETA